MTLYISEEWDECARERTRARELSEKRARERDVWSVKSRGYAMGSWRLSVEKERAREIERSRERERERERESLETHSRWWIELTQIESKEIIEILGFGIRRRFQSQSSKDPNGSFSFHNWMEISCCCCILLLILQFLPDSVIFNARQWVWVCHV